MFNLLKVSLHSADIVCTRNAVQLQHTVRYEGFYIQLKLKSLLLEMLQYIVNYYTTKYELLNIKNFNMLTYSTL